MTETLSIRIDTETKKRLDALAKRSKRSKSFLAAEAIVAYVESEEWQLGELQAGMAEIETLLRSPLHQPHETTTDDVFESTRSVVWQK